MSRKRCLRTLEEWNRDVDLGIVDEPNPPVDGCPNTGIGCPKCGAHVTDLVGHKVLTAISKDPLVVQEGQIIYCHVCGWGGCRKIVKNKYTDFKRKNNGDNGGDGRRSK